MSFLLPNSAAAKSLQSCPALCNPMDCSPPGIIAHPSPPWDSPGKGIGSGLLCPLPGDAPDPGIAPTSLNISYVSCRGIL